MANQSTGPDGTEPQAQAAAPNASPATSPETAGGNTAALLSGTANGTAPEHTPSPDHPNRPGQARVDLDDLDEDTLMAFSERFSEETANRNAADPHAGPLAAIDAILARQRAVAPASGDGTPVRAGVDGGAQTTDAQPPPTNGTTDPGTTRAQAAEDWDKAPPEEAGKPQTRFRFQDPGDQKVAAWSKTLGVSLMEAAQIVRDREQKPAAAADSAPAAPAESVTTLESQMAAHDQRRSELKVELKQARADFEFDRVSELEDERDTLADRIQVTRERLGSVRANEQTAQATAEQAYRSQVESAKAHALRVCPEVARPDSPQGREYARLYDAYLSANDPLLYRPDAVTLITAQVLANVPRAAAGNPPPSPLSQPAPAANGTSPGRSTAPPPPFTTPGSARITPAPNGFAPANAADLIAALEDGGDADALSSLSDVLARTFAGQRARDPLAQFSAAFR